MLLPQTLILMGLICILHGRTFNISWTLQGVETYRDISNPLQTELGDVLRLTCNDTSNLFIQTHISQYNECNASAGLGLSVFNGFCLAGGEILLTLTENSQSLMNTVNFENNNVYYFTSYSNGNIGDASRSSIDFGGQCTEGLKMVVSIGMAMVLDPVGTEGNQPRDEDYDIIVIGCIVSFAGVVCIIIFTVSVIYVCHYCCSKKKTVKIDQESKTVLDTTPTNGSVCQEMRTIQCEKQTSEKLADNNQVKKLKNVSTSRNSCNGCDAVKNGQSKIKRVQIEKSQDMPGSSAQECSKYGSRKPVRTAPARPTSSLTAQPPPYSNVPAQPPPYSSVPTRTALRKVDNKVQRNVSLPSN